MLTQSKQVVPYQASKSIKASAGAKTRVRRKRPWSEYSDARAVFSVVMYLHCGLKKKHTHVSIADICAYINRGSFRKLSKARRNEVKDIFAIRSAADTAGLVSSLVMFLVSEGALEPELCGVEIRYRVCRDEVSVLQEAYNLLYPEKKTGDKPVLILENAIQ